MTSSATASQVQSATPSQPGGESARAAAPAETLGRIFSEFASRRKQEKVAAWMWLQQSLAENAGLLCPSAVSLKDLIAAEANIEDMLKGREGDAGQSPAEYLAAWLSDSSTPPPAKGATQ